MAAVKFKVGDRARVKERDKFINDLSLSDITLNMLCGKEVVIDRILVGHYVVKCAGCGWHLTDEMLEPIPAHRWYVGQEVWDDVNYYGENGKVVGISDEPMELFPIKCRFDSDTEYYSDSGIIQSGRLIKPTLSAVPYTFELPPQPEPIWIPEKWERVLVRNEDYLKWCAHIFFKYHAGHTFPFQIMNEDGGCWKYCIPFDPDKVGKV